MTNKNYRRGYIFERKAMADLLKDGYLPIRSAGSHSLFDIVAIKLGLQNGDVLYKPVIRLIQLKRVKGKYYNFDEEIKNIKSINIKSVLFSKELWVYLDRLKGIRNKPKIEVIYIK